MEYEVLKRYIEKVLHVYSKEISVSVEFATELGADSIDMAQIFGCVEEELGIKLDIKDGLFKAKKQMLMCIVHNKDYKEFKNNILKMDSRAFILTNNCYEASGGVVFSLIPF